jgi:hypothetical protein
MYLPGCRYNPRRGWGFLSGSYLDLVDDMIGLVIHILQFEGIKPECSGSERGDSPVQSAL